MEELKEYLVSKKEDFIAKYSWNDIKIVCLINFDLYS